MQDLTKILKKGDRVWSVVFGEGIVLISKGTESYPIVIQPDNGQKIRRFDKYGCYELGGAPQLYPIDQRPEIPAPIWPEVFEIQGEVYKKGEWVALSDNGTVWHIGRLLGFRKGMCETNFPESSLSLAYPYIRKLTSFNK